MKPSAFALAILLFVVRSRGADWPQFLGPSRDGSSPEKGLVAGWTDAAPRILWKIPCGKGNSQIVVAGGRAFTLMRRDGNEVIVALNADTGAELWSRIVDKAGASGSSTPAIDQGRIYVQANRGPLLCLETDSGKVVWEINVLRTFEANPSAQGDTISPLIDGDLLVTIVGGREAGVVALDKLTGKTVWTSTGDGRGFGSPIIVRVAGRKQVVCHTGRDVIGLARDDGKLLWRVKWDDWGDGDAASPIAVGGRVFVASGADCALFDPAVAAPPDVVWRSKGQQSVMATWYTTAVCRDGYLYGITGGSDSGTQCLNCVEAARGKLVWSKKDFDGNLCLADGNLYVVTLKGELVVVPATPGGFQETGRMPLLGKNDYLNAPGIAGKKLYARDQKSIVCVDLSAQR